MAATREAAKRAVRHRTQGDSTERERLYSLLKWNRRTDASFRHKRMWKSWRGGRSDVTNRIVADAGSYITQARTGTVVSAKSRTRPAHDPPLKGTHLPSGTLRILLQNNGQVELHHAVDEEQVCSARPRGQAMVGGTGAISKPAQTVREITTAKAWATVCPRGATTARSGNGTGPASMGGSLCNCTMPGWKPTVQVPLIVLPSTIVNNDADDREV